jgi:hypothetical protein
MALNARQQLRMDSELLDWYRTKAAEREMTWSSLARLALKDYRRRVEMAESQFQHDMAVHAMLAGDPRA